MSIDRALTVGKLRDPVAIQTIVGGDLVTDDVDLCLTPRTRTAPAN